MRATTVFIGWLIGCLFGGVVVGVVGGVVGGVIGCTGGPGASPARPAAGASVPGVPGVPGAPSVPSVPSAPRPAADSTAGATAAAPAAAAPAITPAVRGAACSREQTCASGLSCLPDAGGSCASSCGAGEACDGACVPTPRAGELCLARCASAADCRAGEGYVCDPAWGACMLPGTAGLRLRACPAPAGAARDRAFGPATRLSPAAPGSYHVEPAAAVTDDGGVVALYAARRGADDAGALALARAGGPAAPATEEATASALARAPALAPTPAGPTAAIRGGPRLARGADGALYAVWIEAATGAPRDPRALSLSLSLSRDGGATWSAPRATHDPADCAAGAGCLDEALVAVGPDPAARGRELVYVLYGAGGGLRVRASRDGGASFGPPRTALHGTRGDAAVSADGRLHVVALAGGPLGGYGAADHELGYAVSDDGGASFSRPVRVSRRDELLPFYFAAPRIAADGDPRRGWIYIVHARGGHDGVWDLVVAATRDRGKTWTRRRIGDDPPCAIHMVPAAALDPATGQLHVAWYDSRGGGRLAHAACAPGAASCTQRGAINDAPFAALSAVRHAPSWIGEHLALAIDARRRTLHAVWAQPITEPGAGAGGSVITARIFHAAAKL